MTEEMEREDVLPPSSDDVESEAIAALSDEQFRAQLWREICDLPPRQRAALLLGMERDDLLLLTESVTQIAAASALPLAEFADLWRNLPLTDSMIAERLGVTSLQVSNLRKCARERLARRMNKTE
jgi:DNA-directed RNA polymerase specialized sigma24 family protein